MNYRRKSWLILLLWYALVDLGNTDDNEISETTPTAAGSSVPTELSNETATDSPTENSTFTGNDNETEGATGEYSNFIPTDVTNKTNFLEHFTKHNWTVLEEFDNAFSESYNKKNDTSANNNREARERNLMVVLPVMQGDSDLSNSNLQTLYTKSPVTAIVGAGQKVEPLRNQDHIRTTIKLVEKHPDLATTIPMPLRILERVDRVVEGLTMKRRSDAKRYPSEEFQLSKPIKKSPLDYGYPDSFKFIEDFNELPRNHKPEWANSDNSAISSKDLPTTEPITRRDPFQMFESVKPLEINKLLSLKPIPVTDSFLEEINKNGHPFVEPNTETPFRPSKRLPNKRPKKPQKAKTTTLFPKITDKNVVKYFTSTHSALVDDPFGFPSESTKKIFLPTPWKELVSGKTRSTSTKTTRIDTTTRPLAPLRVRTTTFTSPPSTTTTQTTVTPEPSTTTTESTITPSTTLSSNATTTTITPLPMTTQSITTLSLTATNPPAVSTTECYSENKNHIKPVDLINLKKILDEEFASWPKPTTTPAPKTTPSRSQFDGVSLSEDMKSMLMALGLLTATPPSTTVTTNNYLEEVFGKADSATPTIDPNSYVSFKKIPIDFERQNAVSSVSYDMKNLLESFGLLPRQMFPSLTRISRQHKFETDPVNATSSSESVVNATFFNSEIPANFTTSLSLETSANSSSTNAAQLEAYAENLDNITPLPFNYVPHPKGHVFHPTVHKSRMEDQQKVRKINDVIDVVKKLSKNDINMSVYEVEKQLENINSLVADEQFSDDPFVVELKQTVHKAKAVIESLDQTKNTLIDLKTNTDLNYNSDESSVVVKTFSNRGKNANLTTFTDSPNPLSSEELQHLFESNKKEIKRQQASSSESSSTTTTKPESNNAPLPELAASFGGGETASGEPTLEDTTTPRPNGLYFFVDWNTFLNVGEDDKKPIRVRFSPRAGNPRYFLPITVP